MLFAREEGYFRETEDDAVMEKVNADGQVIGFSVLKVSLPEGSTPTSVA